MGLRLMVTTTIITIIICFLYNNNINNNNNKGENCVEVIPWQTDPLIQEQGRLIQQQQQ